VFAYRWLFFVGVAKFELDEDAEAVGWLLRSIEANRNYSIAHFVLAGALALLGSLDQARAAANAGLAIDPSFTIRRYQDGALSDNPTYLAARERMYKGMRTAGVPEGVTSKMVPKPEVIQRGGTSGLPSRTDIVRPPRHVAWCRQ
jgi:hypothetical protein